MPCKHVPLGEEEILYRGSSEDEDSDHRQKKRRRREEMGKNYLNGVTLRIDTASLRGPFHNGWRNPWAKPSRLASARRAEEEREKERLETARARGASRRSIAQAEPVRIPDSTGVRAETMAMKGKPAFAGNRSTSAEFQPATFSAQLGHPGAGSREYAKEAPPSQHAGRSGLGQNREYVPDDRPDFPNSPTSVSTRRPKDGNGHGERDPSKSNSLPPVNRSPSPAICTSVHVQSLQNNSSEKPQRSVSPQTRSLDHDAGRTHRLKSVNIVNDAVTGRDQEDNAAHAKVCDLWGNETTVIGFRSKSASPLDQVVGLASYTGRNAALHNNVLQRGLAAMLDRLRSQGNSQFQKWWMPSDSQWMIDSKSWRRASIPLFDDEDSKYHGLQLLINRPKISEPVSDPGRTPCDPGILHMITFLRHGLDQVISSQATDEMNLAGNRHITDVPRQPSEQPLLQWQDEPHVQDEHETGRRRRHPVYVPSPTRGAKIHFSHEESRALACELSKRSTVPNSKVEHLSKPRVRKRKLSVTDPGNVRITKRPSMAGDDRVLNNRPITNSTVVNGLFHPEDHAETASDHGVRRLFSGEENSVHSKHDNVPTSLNVPVHTMEDGRSAESNGPAPSVSNKGRLEQTNLQNQDESRNANATKKRSTSHARKSSAGDHDTSMPGPETSTYKSTTSKSTFVSMHLNEHAPKASLASISNLPEAQMVPPLPLLRNQSSASLSTNAVNTDIHLSTNVAATMTSAYTAPGPDEPSPTKQDLEEVHVEGDSYADLSTQAAMSKAHQMFQDCHDPLKTVSPLTVRGTVPDQRLQMPVSKTPDTPQMSTQMVLDGLRASPFGASTVKRPAISKFPAGVPAANFQSSPQAVRQEITRPNGLKLSVDSQYATPSSLAGEAAVSNSAQRLRRASSSPTINGAVRNADHDHNERLSNGRHLASAMSPKDRYSQPIGSGTELHQNGLPLSPSGPVVAQRGCPEPVVRIGAKSVSKERPSSRNGQAPAAAAQSRTNQSTTPIRANGVISTVSPRAVISAAVISPVPATTRPSILPTEEVPTPFSHVNANGKIAPKASANANEATARNILPSSRTKKWTSFAEIQPLSSSAQSQFLNGTPPPLPNDRSMNMNMDTSSLEERPPSSNACPNMNGDAGLGKKTSQMSQSETNGSPCNNPNGCAEATPKKNGIDGDVIVSSTTAAATPTATAKTTISLPISSNLSQFSPSQILQDGQRAQFPFVIPTQPSFGNNPSFINGENPVVSTKLGILPMTSSASLEDCTVEDGAMEVEVEVEAEAGEGFSSDLGARLVNGGGGGERGKGKGDSGSLMKPLEDDELEHVLDDAGRFLSTAFQ